MSGITGVFYRDRRPADEAAAISMIEAMPHRTRDGRSAWSEGPVALAHGASARPMSKRGSTIVSDSRLDNRRELAAHFGIARENRDAVSDAELLLDAYLTWGENCVDHLLGDFAFAIWDDRAMSLFCARDHFGAKPLCYAMSPSVFAFASEPKALHAHPAFPRELNEQFVCYHFCPELLLEDQTITASRNVVRLEPAHFVSVKNETVTKKAYWTFDPYRESGLLTDRDHFSRFRELFHQSVQRRVRSDSPIGTTLSGGLDSSSVTCVARDLLRSSGSEPLRAYAAVFDRVPSADETPWIDAVAREGGIDLTLAHPDAASPLIDIDTVLWLFDGPFYGANYSIYWHILRSAAEDGVGVLLDGEMGDTVVSHGTDMLAQFVQAGEWRRFDAECDAIVRNFANEKTYASKSGMVRGHAIPYLESLAARGKWVSFHRAAREVTALFDIPGKTLLMNHGIKRTRLAGVARRVLRRNSGFPDASHSMLHPELARRYRIPERLREIREGYQKSRYPAHTRRSHFESLRSGAIAYALEGIERMGAYWGVEVRHPFCDRDFAEFCLSVPPELKLRNGISRYILREALAESIPDEIRLRTGKGDLSEVLPRGLKTYDDSTLLELPKKARLSALSRFVDSNALDTAVGRFENGTSDVSSDLWRVQILDKWIENEETESRDGPTMSHLGQCSGLLDHGGM